MKYIIEFELPDNDTVKEGIKTAYVAWSVWGYSGFTHAKPVPPVQPENDLISRKALCEYALNQKDKSVTPNDIMRFPSAEPLDVQMAYYKGLND